MRAKQVKIAVAALCAAFCAASFGKDFSISDFGAVADGRLCTKAFAAAIDACAAAGGGRVTVPAGTWFTGSIRLKSNVELHLDDKAVVRFSDELADLLPAVMSTYEGVEVFGYCPLIYAYCCTNVAVTGGGLLTTDQTRWRQRQLFAEKDKGARALVAAYNAGVRAQKTPPEKRDVTVYGETFVVRPHFIQLNRCSGARLEGFRLRYSPFWFVEIFKSSDVVCRGVSVFGMFGNSDAFDVDSSQRVLIESCTIDTGDDAFAVKSGRDEDGRRLATPSQDVEIRNCHIVRSGGFVVIGSEITGGAKNVLVHDCTAGVVRDVFVLRSDASRGGHVENITMRNCRVDRCQRWFFNTRSGWPVDPVRVVSMDRVRWTTYDKILVENVVVGDCGQRMNIVGSPDAPYRGVVVRDCSIDSVRDTTNRVENVAADVSLDGLKVLGRALPPRPRVSADDFLMAPDFDYAEIAARVPRSAYLVHKPVKDKAEENIRWKRFSNLRRCGWEIVVEK